MSGVLQLIGRVLLYLAIIGIAVVFGGLIIKALAEEREPVGAAIVFLADVSASMNRDERDFVRYSHVHALVSEEVQTAIRVLPHGKIVVAYVEWASRARVVVPWTIIDGRETAIGFGRRVLRPRSGEDSYLAGIEGGLLTPVPDLGSGTLVHTGMLEAYYLISDIPYDSPVVVVDIVSDGIPAEFAGKAAAQAEIARNTLTSLGVTVNAILVVGFYPSNPVGQITEFYVDHVIGGSNSFIEPVVDINELPTVLRRKLIRELG